MCVPKLFVLQVCAGVVILVCIAVFAILYIEDYIFAIQYIEDFIYNHYDTEQSLKSFDADGSFWVAVWSLLVSVIALYLHPIIYTIFLNSECATKCYVPCSVIVSQHSYICIYSYI